MLRSETDEELGKTEFLAELGIESGTPGPKPSTLSTRLSLHPVVVIFS